MHSEVYPRIHAENNSLDASDPDLPKDFIEHVPVTTMREVTEPRDF